MHKSVCHQKLKSDREQAAETNPRPKPFRISGSRALWSEQRISKLAVTGVNLAHVFDNMRLPFLRLTLYRPHDHGG